MSLIKELKRRNVFRVALAFMVISWLLVQVAATLEEALKLPDWFDAMAISILVIAFPVVLFISWAYEITPDGIKREKDIERDDSISHITAKRLDLLTLFGVLVLVSMLIWQRLSPPTVLQTSADLTNVSEVSSISSPMAAIDLSTIAVLPFVNRSNNEDDLYFTDGMHDDILTQLTKISGLNVISRTSVMAYRNTVKALPIIAEELGAAVVLEGGIQRAGDRIRVNAQLIDVTTDHHLWAETYDREMTVDHIFDIQSEITKHIVRAIKGQLTPQELKVLEDKPTNSLDAWEGYSKARALLRESGYNAEKYSAALVFAEQAVKHDPAFVLAQVMVANLHSSVYWIGTDTSESRQIQAKQELDKAIALAPTSAEVLAAQGEYFYRIMLDFNTAHKYQLMAHEKKPGDGEILQALAFTQRRLGQWEESIANFLKAEQLDPGDLNNISGAIETLQIMGEYDRLNKLMEAAQTRFPDSSDLGAIAVNVPIGVSGDLKAAREIYQQITPNAGDAYVAITINLAYLERDYATVIKTLHQQEVIDFFSNYPSILHLERGQMHLFLEQQQQAMHELNQAVELLSPIDKSGDAFNVSTDLATLAIAKALLGESEQAYTLAKQAMQLLPLSLDKIDGPTIYVKATYAIALAGYRDEALQLIEQLLETPGGFQHWYLYLDPHWDFFRDDDRFNQLIKPSNL